MMRIGQAALGLGCWLLTTLTAPAQWTPPAQTETSSASGQFVVRSLGETDLVDRYPALANEPRLIQFDPAVLAVTAAHARTYFLGQLGWGRNVPWTGKIFLNVHPARSVDEPVRIEVYPFDGVWDYRVEMPDLVSRARIAQALAGVVLLERANAQVSVHANSAPVPAWLADGLAQGLLAGNDEDVLLGKPNRAINGVPETRRFARERTKDPLAGARVILQANPALTFDQLSWPDDNELNGDDGGVYFASAQLFVADLLARPGGPAKLRDFIERLGGCLNWQTAFMAAFHEDFPRMLDVEKWWALRVITFTTAAVGARWSTDASRDRLADLLRVPVEVRAKTNDLPELREFSLTEAIRLLGPAEAAEVAREHAQELRAAQARLAPPYSGLAAEYASVLADFTGDATRPVKLVRNGRVQTAAAPVPAILRSRPVVLRQLAALDRKRERFANDSVAR